MNHCPNLFPTVTQPYRIAFVGEAPGIDELNAGQPFIGSTGFAFTQILTSAGILRDAVFLGNVCQVELPGRRFPVTHPKVREGIAKLTEDIALYRPNLIVLLGQLAMQAAGFGENSVVAWRGSLMKCTNLGSFAYGYKCLASLHPAYVMRQYSTLPLFRFDMRRAREEALTPDLSLPKRDLAVSLTCEQTLSRLAQIRPGDVIAIDIEGGVDCVTCMSIATDPNTAFIVAFGRYTPEQEIQITKALAEVLENPAIGKILQNCLYDNFVMAYTYKIPINNVVDDTMLSGWELYPELPKGLATQTSIYTREPYYKFERKIDDELTHYTYCCKDSCVTYEIRNAHQSQLSPAASAHYHFNLSLLPALEFIQLRGILYDQPAADKLLAQTQTQLDKIKSAIDTLITSKTGRRSDINVNSNPQLCNALYKTFSFPPQHPKERGKLVKSKLTCGIDALLKLAKSYSGPDSLILHKILQYRKLEKHRQALEAGVDPDGRRRGSYNLVGTETGRTQASKANTGNGVPLQGVTKSLRKLYIADPNYFLFQCDLAGADGWTVAAYCRQLGDSTMWDDYVAGIKPAKVLALLYTHGPEVSHWSRDQLLQASKTISEEGDNGWLYFACKRVQHGTNYDMFKNTMSVQILKDSWNKLGQAIFLSPTDCAKLQNLYLSGRYQGVALWQNWVKYKLETTGQLSCASGHVRTFFGRKTDPETYRKALAHGPQANTTYATNLAMSRLWTDPHNRRPDGSIIIEPLHQVHDAIIGQFPQDQIQVSLTKIRSYFDNTIPIGEDSVKIPFDGGYGKSWGELDTAI